MCIYGVWWIYTGHEQHTNNMEAKPLGAIVGIHNGPRGNKVDGLFGFDDLNKATSRTAGRGLKENKTKRDNKQDKRQSETNEARCARLLGA